MTKNVVGWFEIPVADMARAVQFYETVMQVKMDRRTFGPLNMASFPSVSDGIGSPGALVYHPEFYKPSRDGALLYFTTPTGNLDSDAMRVEQAGGKILIPKKTISPEYGAIVVVLDSEGNRIVIHSRAG